jgi:7-keto-8-aminopelargonate synthetase-like enzyme
MCFVPNAICTCPDRSLSEAKTARSVFHSTASRSAARTNAKSPLNKQLADLHGKEDALLFGYQDIPNSAVGT